MAQETKTPRQRYQHARKAAAVDLYNKFLDELRENGGDPVLARKSLDITRQRVRSWKIRFEDFSIQYESLVNRVRINQHSMLVTKAGTVQASNLTVRLIVCGAEEHVFDFDKMDDDDYDIKIDLENIDIDDNATLFIGIFDGEKEIKRIGIKPTANMNMVYALDAVFNGDL